MEGKLRSAMAGLPRLRRALRRGYQRGAVFFSRRAACEGALKRVTPDDGGEWFFGYYDKSPWDAGGRRFLCLRADSVDAPAPARAAQLFVIEGGRARKIADTRAWNAQQGCMAQWLGPDFSARAIFNDFRDGKFVSVICDMGALREERVLPMPVYAVSDDGKTALSLDFARLHRLRPGYGYSNLPDAGEKLPDGACVWKIDLATGETTPILSYRALAAFEEKASMRGAEHKINHLMINPSGTRFMALHRWFEGAQKHTRLLTFDMDGANPFTLADEDFVSHCAWADDRAIVSFCRLGGQDGYYRLTDRTLEHARLWQQLSRDGHMSPSAEGLFVTDTYPDKRRMQSVYLMDGQSVRRAARVFSPFRFDGDIRCDLHPRFDRAGERVMIDATFEGRRAMYALPVRADARVPRVLSIVTVPMAFDGPTMSLMRYMRAMDQSRLQADFVAINEPPEAIRREIRELGGRLYVVGARLKHPVRYLLRLARIVRAGRYDVVHAHGNSCTLAIEMLAALMSGAKARVAHSLNSSCKFKLAHRVLRPLFDRLYTDAYACGTEAGEWLFCRRPFRVARVAIETGDYAFDPAARARCRRDLDAESALIVGCVAHFTPHKNHAFLIPLFAQLLRERPEAVLALVGEGALRPEVEAAIAQAGIADRVRVLGLRTDVARLLSAFDVMVLPSLYEGFPNALVEWQCSGLKSFVSDTVTRAAGLTDLVDFLPIDSPAPWVEALSSFHPSADRAELSRAAVETVRSKGYDIRENARAMQAFYDEVVKRTGA